MKTPWMKRGNRGATMVEYGLMIALIAFVLIGVVTLIGVNMNNIFQAIAQALQ